jgi:hypothetical protein
MSHATRTLMTALALVAAACSGGSGGGSGTAPPTATTASRDQYAARLAEWLCDDLAACCAGQQPLDRDECVAAKTAAELRRVASEEAKSGRVFDEAMAATCLARLDETPAACAYPRRVKECFQTYDGVRELGEACESKQQCRGSLSGEVACIAGRCTTRLAAGEACPDLPGDSGRCDVCRPDARCRQGADGSHACYRVEFRRGVAGDPCYGEFRPPADPTSVSVVADCAPEDGLYCSSDGVCTPFAPIGGACTQGRQCGPGKRCVAGVCTEGLAAGEVCRSSFNDCGPGLYCRWTDVVCTDPGPGSECSGYELLEGVCAVPSGPGEACVRFVDCTEGLRCTTRGEPAGGQCIEPPSACSVGLDRLAREAARLSQ